MKMPLKAFVLPCLSKAKALRKKRCNCIWQNNGAIASSKTTMPVVNGCKAFQAPTANSCVPSFAKREKMHQPLLLPQFHKA